MSAWRGDAERMTKGLSFAKSEPFSGVVFVF
jgi:hypothetical protein